MKPTQRLMISMLAGMVLTLAFFGCGEDFPPASKVDQQRFLGIIAEPLEAAPGQDVTFTALVVNADGTPYEGSIAWAIMSDSTARTNGDQDLDFTEPYLQTPGGDPFVWTVPEKSVLEETFGSMGPQGMLLSVVAAAFKGGEPTGDALTSIKLFSVSERAENKRMKNPAFEDFKVIQKGKTIKANQDGEYEVSLSEHVGFVASSESGTEDITFHWFAHMDEENFFPDLTGHQTIGLTQTGLLYIYCVQRQRFDFVLGEDTKANLTGTDWRIIPLRIE